MNKNILTIVYQSLKTNKIMKTVLQISSALSMFLAVFETFKGRTETAILFSVWSFYLKYLSNQNK